MHVMIISNSVAQDVKYGLGFNSFEFVQEKRTGLNLTPSDPFSFTDGFTLSFDVCFQSNFRSSYGYVFRIIGQNDQHIDFLLSETNLVVNHSLSKTIAEFSFEEIDVVYDRYFPFEIQLDIKNSILNVSLNNETVSVKNVSLKAFEKVNIVFGKCNYLQLQISDIPKMSIKDIRVNNHKGIPVYYWPLSRHTQSGVYDELKKHFAFVENPQWMLVNYASWKKLMSFNTGYHPQIYYNTDKESVGVFDQKSVFTYYLNSQQLKEESQKSTIPDNYFYTNQTIYNPFTRSFLSYFDVEDQVITHDTLGKTMDFVIQERTTAYYFHHNKVISSFDSCLYIFGGYGHHKYNNVISKYDFETQVWEELQFEGDRIQPRYLSGLGVIDENRILIFGGYGSETGAQELSPQNYYDLYIVDLKERTIRKIWELLPAADNLVVANSMVVDTLNNCFYALCFPQQRYNTSLYIGKFSLEAPEYNLFADSIPFSFEDIYSYADLFLNRETDELIAITSSPVVKDSSAIVSIYSHAYPPLAENDLYQVEEKGNLPGFQFIIIISTSLLFCICCGIVYFRKKKNVSVKKAVEPSDEPKPEVAKMIMQTKPPTSRQSILLFGGFKVINRDGQNITGEFSPLLKQLFLVILLNTLKDGKGISSLKLKETLWFDKTPESARNNRGVLLSRLRQLFDQVGSINIENRNSIWMINFGDDVYCDYYEAIHFMTFFNEKENLTGDNLRKLLTMVSRGELLPNLQIDWIDPFKADFSNSLIDLLMDFATHSGLRLSPQEYIDLADAIFIHDSLNEDALKIKCKTLLKMGKNGLAKSAYTSFQKEYQVSLGINFECSFEQIIS